MKFTKFSLNQLNTLLNNEWSVNRYHKLLLHTYKRVFLSLYLEK